jgi:uncharacterized integral membrane protein (TIGR00697 family)
MANRILEKIPAKDHRLAGFRYFELLVHAYVVVLLISNLVGQKTSAFGPFRVSGAQLLFPITYIFSDIFTEVYGYAASRRAIWIAFMASILMAAMGMFMVWIPAAAEWKNQAAFEAVFGAVPRMVAASLAAFWAGEFTNSYVLARMKVWTGGRWLWTRTVGSTVAGQLVDSIIVTFGFFYGRESVPHILQIILSGYVAKVLYEAAATPLTYLIVNGLKKAEGVDVYDVGTDFNPFGRERRTEASTEAP